MRRRGLGFTFIEILMGVTLSTTVLGAAWALFNLSNRSQGATAAARAVETAAIIEETIQQDMRLLISVGGHGLRFWPDDSSKLNFYAADPTQTWKGNAVKTLAVRWFLEHPATDKNPAHLMREVNRKAEAVGPSVLTSMAFQPFLSPNGVLVRVTMRIGRDSSEPAGPAHVHSFLARPGHQRTIPAMAFVLSGQDFPNRDQDAPQGQQLPKP